MGACERIEGFCPERVTEPVDLSWQEFAERQHIMRLALSVPGGIEVMLSENPNMTGGQGSDIVPRQQRV